ncbi:rab GTPase-binding effector protein 1 isoform X1 [Episyrphus balteatus]|uniref:rab GTPase-binding effector protein 1 isoform X1 n=1 Tax=Episyrphus balteatus TaxID=286459 RepID=UPI002484E8D5|nr:rab GTPase-binding effector protein 1 isoform X1 [Episyrphus balteatus]
MEGEVKQELSGPLPQEEDLQKKIQSLEAENKKMHTEFNTQRAKLKDLFIQKEAEYTNVVAEKNAIQRELDELKSLVMVAECRSDNERELSDLRTKEEISSLQLLVQETIEESAICKADLESLQEDNKRLRQENRELKEGIIQLQQEPTSMAVLSHVKKTLARKLGGDSASHDTLDDSMRKVNKYAQEDAEVLRSLVVPLEEEIKALKEKLRSTDEELQGLRNQKVSPQAPMVSAIPEAGVPKPIDVIVAVNNSVSKSTSMEFQCDSCRNFDEELQKTKEQLTQSQVKIEALKKTIEESAEDIKKEAALRKDLEDQWQEKREAHKNEVQYLKDHVKKSETELLDLQQQFLEAKNEITTQLLRLSDDRERVNKQLETLQADNDYLSGRYLATAEEIENQYINLPNNVEELHELLLRQQSDFIQARVGCEFEKQKCVSYADEVQILRDQLDANINEKRAYKKKVQTEMKSLQDRLTEYLLTQQKYETMKNTFERKESELNKQISEFRVQVIELQEMNEKLSRINVEYKSKIKNLQDDLATSEHVQRDFVKLSQNLQITIEKFRQPNAEVRWQDDEDIDNCPNCNTFFTVTVRKQHCRHCGVIYCDKCLNKSVPSGPRQKLARVCELCHTLLAPNAAPYFSQEPPQSP